MAANRRKFEESLIEPPDQVAEGPDSIAKGEEGR